MPNCFQLVRKSDPQAGPVVLTQVDEEICSHLGIACDPEKWALNWYNTIGLGLACGRTFDDLRKTYSDPEERIKLINFLDENFTTNCWYEHK